jgi:hypothetical protein
MEGLLKLSLKKLRKSIKKLAVTTREKNFHQWTTAHSKIAAAALEIFLPQFTFF